MTVIPGIYKGIPLFTVYVTGVIVSGEGDVLPTRPRRNVLRHESYRSGVSVAPGYTGPTVRVWGVTFLGKGTTVNLDK